MSSQFEDKLLELVHQLRNCRVSAPPEHPVRPQVCTDAADFMESLLSALKQYEAELADFMESVLSALKQYKAELADSDKKAKEDLIAVVVENHQRIYDELCD